MRQTVQSSSGAALAEFAIGLPVILLMLAYTIELGNVISSKQSLAAVARDVARIAADMGPGGLDCQKLTAEAKARLAEGVDVYLDPCPPTIDEGTHQQDCDDEVTVVIKVDDPPSLWGYLGIFDFSLEASATSRLNNGILCSIAPV